MPSRSTANQSFSSKDKTPEIATDDDVKTAILRLMDQEKESHSNLLPLYFDTINQSLSTLSVTDLKNVLSVGLLLGKKYVGLGEETVKTTINISLHIENHELDLRIPNQVTLVRLKALLEPILREERLLQFEDFELVSENKQIVVNGQRPLVDYPLSDAIVLESHFANLMREKWRKVIHGEDVQWKY